MLFRPTHSYCFFKKHGLVGLLSHKWKGRGRVIVPIDMDLGYTPFIMRCVSGSGKIAT